MYSPAVTLPNAGVHSAGGRSTHWFCERGQCELFSPHRARCSTTAGVVWNQNLSQLTAHAWEKRLLALLLLACVASTARAGGADPITASAIEYHLNSAASPTAFNPAIGGASGAFIKLGFTSSVALVRPSIFHHYPNARLPRSCMYVCMYGRGEGGWGPNRGAHELPCHPQTRSHQCCHFRPTPRPPTHTRSQHLNVFAGSWRIRATPTHAPRRPQAQDDIVTFYLKGFGGGDIGNLQGSSQFVSPAPFSPSYAKLKTSGCSWTEATKLLTLKVNSAVPAATAFAVTVKGSSGITLPQAGLFANDQQLRVFATTGGQACERSPVVSSPAVTPQVRAGREEEGVGSGVRG